MVNKFDHKFSRVDTISECDRQKDGQNYYNKIALHLCLWARDPLATAGLPVVIVQSRSNRCL